MPTKERWVFVLFGAVFELISIFYFISVSGKRAGELKFFIALSLLYWAGVLSCKNLKVFLAVLTVILAPYNRFLILSIENAYLLGRVSDYLLISLHLFEIPLYTFAIVLCLKNIRNIRFPEKFEIFKNPLHFSFFLFLFSFIYLVVKNNFLLGFSRLQLLFVFMILYFSLRELSIRKIFTLISVSAVIQSIIAFFQVGLNHSFGLSFIGESVFNESLFYIAKSFIFNQFRVRAYGTFPHPNLLSAFLFFAVILSCYFLIKNFYVRKHFINLQNTGRVGVLSIFLLGIYLAQSRTVILSIILSVVFFLFLNIFKNFGGRKMRILLILAVIFTSFLSFIIFHERIISLLTYDKSSFTNRLELQESSINSLSKSKIFGLGPNGYLQYLAENKGVLTNYSFIVEPVHNVFLLILSEYGIIIFVLFVFFILNISLNSVRLHFHSQHIYIAAPIVIFLFLSLNLDHYLLTLKQGVFLFALCFRLINGRMKQSISR